MKNTLTWLSMWQNNAGCEEFQEIFGDAMGIHLWHKFRDLKHNILFLWNVLDKDNQEILSSYMMKCRVR